MLAVSATVRTSVEKGHNRPLLPRNRRLKVTGKILWKGKLPHAAVLLERDIKRMPLDLSDQDYGGTLKLLLWVMWLDYGPPTLATTSFFSDS